MLARAFTLLELLIVVAIIGVLVAIMIPAIEKSNERARIAVCAQNLHQFAVALNTYSNDFSTQLPLGPETPSTLDPTRPWNTLGNNLLWIAAGSRYNGLGVLTTGGYLTDPRSLVCPSDADSTLKSTIGKQLAGTADVYGSYAYRQLDQRSSSRLLPAGSNTLGNPSRALALDWQSLGPAPYARNSHDHGEYLNILYADGHIQYFRNEDLDFGASDKAYSAMPGSYIHRLDQIWINADWAEGNPVDTAPKLP